MKLTWFKRYLPRGIYGRAALILILPVITLQLVVSVVFIQRHFEGVTKQMTRSISHEIALIHDEIEKAGSAEQALAQTKALAEALSIDIRFLQDTDLAEVRRWFDLSGTIVISELNANLPFVAGVHLPDDFVARIFVDTKFGIAALDVNRRRLSARNPHQLFVHMAFFGILMTLIAFIYLRNQLRPIKRLATAAEAFGKGRTIAYHPSGAVEVRAAGNAFLDMRSRIERQIEQRTMLLSGVSHDLRTPLTRLRLGLALLDDDERVPLERDVDDMQRMLDEFLNFARGAAETEPEKVDLRDFLSELVSAINGNHSNRVHLQEPATRSISVKKMVLQRAIENLILNALRYGDSVEVSVQQHQRSLVIQVDDDGPGIPENQREEALKPFSRLEPARNQNKGSGVGLGLAIAADAARAHGGILRLKDSSMGGLSAQIVIAI